MFNPLERIKLYKFTYLHSEGMQGFQVRENGFEQVIIVYLGLVKRLKKNGIKRRIK
jgi:predicted transcriptional regulator with HTH domain